MHLTDFSLQGTSQRTFSSIRQVGACLVVRLAILLLIAVRAVAQESTNEATLKGPEEFPLELKEMEGIQGGRAAMRQGIAETSGHHFTLSETTILQPILITLVARDPAQALELRLFKEDWRKAELEGATEEFGKVSFMTRTEGAMKIQVRSVSGVAEYQLLVWVGDEVQVDPPTAFVSMQQNEEPSIASATSPQGSKTSIVLWVIAAALIGILVLLVIVVLKKK